MSTFIIKIAPDAALLSDPESEEAQLQNLCLNVMAGLKYADLTPDEKALLAKHGYNHEGNKNETRS